MGPMLLVAAIVAAVGALIASLWAREGRPDPAAARASLGISAGFTAAAAALLAGGLFGGNLSLAFVAQHLTTNLPLGSRALAMWADTPGSALVTATLVSVTGVIAAVHPAAIALIAATLTALLAAAISGGALSGLPWTPIDGLGLSPVLRHPLALAAVIAASVSGVSATMACVAGWQHLPRGESAARWAVTAFSLLLITAVVHGTATVLSGSTSTAALMGGAPGVWLVAAVTAGWSALAFRRVDSVLGIRPLAAGALCGGVLAGGLAGVGDALPGPAIQAIGLISLVAGVYAALAWRGRAAAPRLDPASLLVLLSLGVVATAAVTGQRRAMHRATAESGQEVELNGVRLAHQGISRYEAEQAHVLAVALERQRPRGAQLARAEQREYFDSRGAIVGDVVHPPAVFRGPWRTSYVWLDGVEAGDVVRLRMHSAIFEGGWWLAVLLACAAALLAWTSRSRANPATTPLLCAACGVPAASGARWCSNCGQQLA